MLSYCTESIWWIHYQSAVNNFRFSVAPVKEKKKKGLKKNTVSGEEDAGANAPSTEDFRRAMELLSLTQPQGSVKTTEDAMTKQYEFWNTQPVPKIGLFLYKHVYLFS